MSRRICSANALLLVVVMTILLGCLRPPGNGGSGETDGDALVSNDGVSQITLPDGWSKQSDLNDQADLQAGSALGQVYLIVLTEPKSDFGPSMTISQHSDLTRPNITNALLFSNVTGPKSLTINGRDAVQYEIRGQMNDLDIVYFHTTVDGRDHFHQVLSWTLADSISKNRQVLDEALDSFKEVGY